MGIYRKIWIILAAVLLASSCVSPYEAEIEEEKALISIEGSLIKGIKTQTVTVSMTRSLSKVYDTPVAGCDVTLIDELDNAFRYKEQRYGVFTWDVPDDALVYGRNYMIRVITPEGEVYESDFEMLNEGIPVDSVYYRIEDRVDAATGDAFSGLQFYLDIEAEEEDSRYFRWRLDESFEYTSISPISFVYRDLNLVPEELYDPWEFFRCWYTEDVDGIYLSSTMSLALNEKRQIPLNYVSDRTDKLKIEYSLLVEQYPLSEAAYDYFEQNRIATQESDGLYTRQPRQPITNIQNMDNPDERILGYFWVSSVSSKRIFVPRIPEMDIYEGDCALSEFDASEDGFGPFPAYIYYDKESGIRYTAAANCFICTKRGGTLTKPDYWR